MFYVSGLKPFLFNRPPTETLLKNCLYQGWIQGVAIGAIAPQKPTRVTFFTIILHNSETSIRDIRPFCCPLFCNSSVMKHTSSLLK